ncbi:hypothetical protein V2J09_024296 [Rumex salicifolius]
MEASVLAMEGILNYTFRNPKLLEDALTHPSSPAVSSSYGRMEFLGDAALGLAFTNFLYLAYPDLDEGSLTLLRSVNVSNERLARVAVRHHFYRFMRHNLTNLHDVVNEFTLAVLEEDSLGCLAVFGGAVKAPKVLADMVESIAAAVYMDCGFDIKAFWTVFEGFLKPIVTWEILQEQPQPVTKLFQLCQKQKKQIHIKQWKEVEVYFANIYVDDYLVASGSSTNKDSAKLNAAREALSIMFDDDGTKLTFDVGQNNEIIAAKRKLFEICRSKKWGKPSYRLEKEEGPSHDRRYVCCVELEVEEAVYLMHGDERPRLKDAENSAASFMIYSLLKSGRAYVYGRMQSGATYKRQTDYFFNPNLGNAYWISRLVCYVKACCVKVAYIT